MEFPLNLGMLCISSSRRIDGETIQLSWRNIPISSTLHWIRTPQLLKRTQQLGCAFEKVFAGLGTWEFDGNVSKGGSSQFWWKQTRKAKVRKQRYIHSERMIYTSMLAKSRRPWKLVWKTNLPMKIKCFSWITLNNVSLTLDNLNRKSLQLVNICSFCKKIRGRVSLIFLHCPLAYYL